LKTKSFKTLFILLFLVLSVSLIACSQKGDVSPLSLVPLEDMLSNGKPTLAEFGWRECIPCKTMRPIMEELAKEYKDKLNVVIVDLPLRTDLAEKYSIEVMPVQIIFDSSGNEMVRHAGSLPKEQIVAQLNELDIKK